MGDCSVVCAEMQWKEHGQLSDLDVPAIPSATCTNGEVNLGYGSPEFIGLGFSVMVFLVFIELFGSVFMKNCSTCLDILCSVLTNQRTFKTLFWHCCSATSALEFPTTKELSTLIPRRLLWQTRSHSCGRKPSPLVSTHQVSSCLDLDSL